MIHRSIDQKQTPLTISIVGSTRGDACVSCSASYQLRDRTAQHSTAPRRTEYFQARFVEPYLISPPQPLVCCFLQYSCTNQTELKVCLLYLSITAVLSKSTAILLRRGVFVWFRLVSCPTESRFLDRACRQRLGSLEVPLPLYSTMCRRTLWYYCTHTFPW